MLRRVTSALQHVCSRSRNMKHEEIMCACAPTMIDDPCWISCVRTYVLFTFDVCCACRVRIPSWVCHTKGPWIYRHVCDVRRKFNSDNVSQQNYRVLNITDCIAEHLCSFLLQVSRTITTSDIRLQPSLSSNGPLFYTIGHFEF